MVYTDIQVGRISARGCVHMVVDERARALWPEFAEGCPVGMKVVCGVSSNLINGENPRMEVVRPAIGIIVRVIPWIRLRLPRYDLQKCEPVRFPDLYSPRTCM